MTHRASIAISEPIRRWDLDGFHLAERHHPPDWTLHSHAHETPMIALVLAGSYTEAIGRRNAICAPKSLQVLPAGERHILKFADAEVRCLTVEVGSRRLAGIRRVSKVLDQYVYVREGALSPLLTRLYREFRTQDSIAALTLEGLILEILGEVSRENIRRASPVQPRWLSQARDLVHTHALERVSLIDVAASVGVHPAHLARMFRRFFGTSVGEYVRSVRLDWARQELAVSNKSLAEIAAAAGFYDQSHFTNVFHRNQRMTPSEYRAARQGCNAGPKKFRFSKTE